MNYKSYVLIKEDRDLIMQNLVVIKDMVPGFYDACMRLASAEGVNLSTRESQILVLLSREFTVCKIAELLGREKTTVYKHLENARAKMSCNSLLSLGLKLSHILNI